ncbi:DUF362 domain-containing protein [candidate division KSB1 bacterium]|nr:DUF362 domain-containing protein [candidate division KSB1 bacterium]
MEKTIVSSQRIDGDYKQALMQVLKHLPDFKKKLKHTKQIVIRISSEHFFYPLCTSPDLLLALLTVIRMHNPHAVIHVMDNHLRAHFARLVSKLTGLAQISQSKKARHIFLDEKREVQLMLGPANNTHPVLFPSSLIKSVKAHRKELLYINVANVRTHHNTVIQAGMAGQLGWLGRSSRGIMYTPLVHRLIGEALEYIQPDLTILDANTVLAHGMIPPDSSLEEMSIQLNHLLASEDVVAADRMAIELLGIDPKAVQHLGIAQELKLGNSDLKKIEILGEFDPPEFQIPWSPLIKDLPTHIDIIIGANMSVDEPLLAQAMEFMHIMRRDFGGHGYFTLVIGNGFQDEQLNNLREPVVVLGHHACTQVGEKLFRDVMDVFFIPDPGQIDQFVGVIRKVMGVGKYQFLGVNPFRLWRSMFWGRLHGLHYRIPRVLMRTRQYKKKKPAQSSAQQPVAAKS